MRIIDHLLTLDRAGRTPCSHDSMRAIGSGGRTRIGNLDKERGL